MKELSRLHRINKMDRPVGAEKQIYTCPRLIEYGMLIDLTSSGTLGNADIDSSHSYT